MIICLYDTVAVDIAVSSEQLNNAYRRETNEDIKERILLVRYVIIDGHQVSKVVTERELTEIYSIELCIRVHNF